MPILSVDQGAVGQVITLVTSDQVPIPARLVAAAGNVDAVDVTYTPAVAGDWPIPAPANVAAALDLLAAIRGQFHSNVNRSPVAGETQTATIGPIPVVPSKSGVYLAWASLELICSGTAADAATLEIQADGAPLGNALASGYTVGESTLTLTQLGLVALNRAVPHNWALVWDTTDPLTTGHVEIGRGKLVLLEL